jgi:hypothetical protein
MYEHIFVAFAIVIAVFGVLATVEGIDDDYNES